MDILQNAKTVRLKSHHGKYLIADLDRDSVFQSRKKGGSRNARWTVEYVDGLRLIRLKSCYDTYLTATNDNFLIGVTGKKVKQTAPQQLDSTIEWEPIQEQMHLKLKTRYGNFLRGNKGPPPWRKSVTHDVPSRTHTKEWVRWELDILQYGVPNTDKDKDKENEKEEVAVPQPPTVKKVIESQGRVVSYNVVDDNGNIIEGENSTVFSGKGVDELGKMMEEETGLSDVIICLCNPVTKKLYPVMFSLPPDHVKLHIYVVPSSSTVAKELDP